MLRRPCRCSHRPTAVAPRQIARGIRRERTQPLPSCEPFAEVQRWDVRRQNVMRIEAHENPSLLNAANRFTPREDDKKRTVNRLLLVDYNSPGRKLFCQKNFRYPLSYEPSRGRS